jgi:hypothetical protein
MAQLFRTLLASLSLALLTAGAISACGDDGGTTTTTTGNEVDAADTVDAPDPADQFCADYESICGYNNSFGGDPYTDLQDCLDRFHSYSASRQSCVIMHLAFAAGGMASLHCTHAEGLTECAGP